MNGHVTLEVVMPGKLLPANCALIRLLFRVSHHVSFQCLVLGEKAPHTLQLNCLRREGKGFGELYSRVRPKCL